MSAVGYTVCTVFNNSPWVTCSSLSWASLCFSSQVFPPHHSAAAAASPPLHHYLPPPLQSCWVCAALVSATTRGWTAAGWYQRLPSSLSTRWTCGCPIKSSYNYNFKLHIWKQTKQKLNQIICFNLLGVPDGWGLPPKTTQRSNTKFYHESWYFSVYIIIFVIQGNPFIWYSKQVQTNFKNDSPIVCDPYKTLYLELSLFHSSSSLEESSSLPSNSLSWK